MPLKKGPGRKKHAANVKELMETYKAGGKIGNTKPKGKKHAMAIANAIAYRESRGH